MGKEKNIRSKQRKARKAVNQVTQCRKEVQYIIIIPCIVHASLVFLFQMWLHARMCSWIMVMVRARVRVGPRIKVRVRICMIKVREVGSRLGLRLVLGFYGYG